MEEHSSKPSTGEGEAQVSSVQRHPQLHREFKAILGYLRSCVEKSKICDLSPKVNEALVGCVIRGVHSLASRRFNKI